MKCNRRLRVVGALINFHVFLIYTNPRESAPILFAIKFNIRGLPQLAQSIRTLTHQVNEDLQHSQPTGTSTD